jgi:Ca2+/Na+ antiporter
MSRGREKKTRVVKNVWGALKNSTKLDFYAGFNLDASCRCGAGMVWRRFFCQRWCGACTLGRWPTAVIGVTVAAFGTSSPELLVAIHSALDGVPEISLGDVFGSNVVNVALVLTIVLALSGMQTEDSGVRRDWFISLLVPGVVYTLLFDGWFSRLAR